LINNERKPISWSSVLTHEQCLTKAFTGRKQDF
jgi:hypothetical protein